MRGIFIDPGAIRLGWAILETGPKYIASGISGLKRPVMGIKPNGKPKLQPFQEYKLALEDYWGQEGPRLLDLYQPSVLCNEILPAVGGGNFTVATQSELAKTALTCVHVLALERGMEVYQIGANTIKLKVGQSGSASKVRVRNGVIAMLPELAPRIKDWTSAKAMDEPDAIAVGLTYLNK